MSTDIAQERLTRRIQVLNASDPQFAAARPDEAVSAAIERPGLRLPQLVQAVMDGYANRPALGQRAVQLVTDPDTGRTTGALLPRFEMLDLPGVVAAGRRSPAPGPTSQYGPVIVCAYWVSPAWTTPSSMWR